jgi:hypothetical protein
MPPPQPVTARIDDPEAVSSDEVPAIYPTIDGELMINTGTYQQSAAIQTGGLTTPIDGPIPSVGDTVGVSINDEEVAVAEVGETGRDGEGLVQLICYTRERQLFQNTLTGSYTDAPPADVLVDAFGSAGVPLIAERAYPFAGDFGDIFSAGGEIIAAALREARQSEEITITADYQQVRAVDVIESVTRQAGWEWKIARGEAWFGHPGLANLVANDPDSEAPDDLAEQLGDAATPQTWNLRWVLSDGTSPQDQAVAFDIIRVVGQAVEYAPDSQIRVTDPIVAEIDVVPESERPFGGSPRVHVFESDRVTDQAQANNVARAMWRKVQEQRSTGTIRTVGDTRLRPLDSCRMLPELSRSDPADFYKIQSVIHRINSSDGFTTEVSVEGYNEASPPDIRTEISDATVVSGSSSSQDASGEDTANGGDTTNGEGTTNGDGGGDGGGQ